MTTLTAVAVAAVLGANPVPEGLLVGERFADGSGVVVVNAVDGRQQWYTLPTSFRDSERLAGIQAAMPEVDEILASPDGRWLAVVSSAEGHPELEVIDLPMLLAGRGWLVVAALDPFPGSLRVAGWLDGELVIKSEWPLTRCRDGCTNVAGPLAGGERAYLLDPEHRFLRVAGAGDLERDRERRLELDEHD